MNSSKTLVILDLDDTHFAALPRLHQCLSKLMADFALAHGITMDHVVNLVREAHGQHRFNDGAALVDAMVAADPSLQRFNHSYEHREIQNNWIKQSEELTVFSPGVLESFKFWNSSGVACVIQTDCEDIAAIRNLWMLGVNATKHGQLNSPYDILDFYQRIYCQPGIEPSSHLLGSIAPDFMAAAEAKMHRWDDRLYKPTEAHIKRILSDTGVSPLRAVYIGDSHKDGAEAKSANPAMDFAWARYGARISAEVLALCGRVASRSFSYGEEAIRAEMDERLVRPDVVLEHSMGEIISEFSWKPA